MYPEKRKKKIWIPFAVIGGILFHIILSFAILVLAMSPIMHPRRPASVPSGTATSISAGASEPDASAESEEAAENKAQEKLDELYQYVAEENQDFAIDTRVDSFSQIRLFQSSELDDVLGYPREAITYDDILNDIQKNPYMSSSYKDLLILLANNLRAQYPELDLRIWHVNLQTLKVEEVPEFEMHLKAMSADACACYRQDENTIYTVDEYEYIPGTWEYQVIMHEFGHPIRTLLTEIGEYKIRSRFESYSGYGTVTGEAMNSLLTLRSYDPDERDVAYQFQSNMVELMVTEMDNYSYQDFVEHDLTYFEQKLNEYNGDEDAVEMIGLLELQYDDFHDDEYEIEETEFHKLYDYIADMYYGNHLTPGMTRDEALQVQDEFIDRLTFDVPEEYHISVDHLNEYFEEYCTSAGM